MHIHCVRLKCKMTWVKKERKSFNSPPPPTLSHDTHRNQSTAKIRLMSSVGSPTEVSTISIVMRPALGILAAPILAHVAVKLKQKKTLKQILMKPTLYKIPI